ncbi:MAG: hypothetical protein ACYS0D_02095, partial [Planctomycetota bacterium]
MSNCAQLAVHAIGVACLGFACSDAMAGDQIFDNQADFFDAAGTLATETFEDEPTIGTPGGGAQAMIELDDFTATSEPPALKILDAPFVGNHNTTPGGVKYLSADTDLGGVDSDVTFTFDTSLTEFGMYITDNEGGIEIIINNVSHIVPSAGDGSEQYFAIISETAFSVVFIDIQNGDSHTSFDDVSYSVPSDDCFQTLTETVTCHPDGTSFTYTIQGFESCSNAPFIATTTAAGGAVGEEMCFTLVIRDESGEICCTTVACVVIPDCSLPTSAFDLDADGVVGTGDLLTLVGQWGACDDCNQCTGDFDGDCVVGS